MASLKDMEPLVDECAEIFMNAMHDLAGQKIDFGEWLQWYAFDVVANITFNDTYGFMDRRQDVGNMIQGVDFAMWYSSIAGLVPWIHKWALGNPTTIWLISKFGPSEWSARKIMLQVRQNQRARHECSSQ